MKLQLPIKLTVGPCTYSVEYSSTISEQESNNGTTDFQSCKIIIQEQNDSINPQVVLNTIAHEFAHAYYHHNDRRRNTEDNCDRFEAMFWTLANQLFVEDK